MRAFRFSLEPVLSYRRQVEELRKREFALAHRAAQEQLQVLQRLYAEEGSAKDDLRDLERRLEIVDVLAQRRYLFGLGRRIQNGREVYRQRTEVQARARGAYVESRRARRVLERLRERKLSDWSMLTVREEQKLTDEVAARARAPWEAGWTA